MGSNHRPVDYEPSAMDGDGLTQTKFLRISLVASVSVC